MVEFGYECWYIWFKGLVFLIIWMVLYFRNGILVFICLLIMMERKNIWNEDLIKVLIIELKENDSNKEKRIEKNVLRDIVEVDLIGFSDWLDVGW